MGVLHEARVFLVGERPATKAERSLLFKIDRHIHPIFPLLGPVHELPRPPKSGKRQDLSLVLVPVLLLLLGGVDTEICHHVWQIQALRFCMAIFEAVSFAGGHYVIGSWYKPSELAKRACLLTAAQNAGGMLAGIMQGAIYTTLNGSLGISGWRWLMIINSLMTYPIWIWGFLTFPGAPAQCNRWYLSEEEKKLAISRLPPHKPTPLDRGCSGRWGETGASGPSCSSSRSTPAWSGLDFPISLWTKWTGRYTIPEINYHSLGITAVTIASTCLFALWTDYTRSRWWMNVVMAVCSGVPCVMLLVPSLPVAAKYAAWYLAGMGFIGQAVNFAWANAVCRDDDQLRSVTLYAMVYGSNVTIAWFNLVFFPVTDAADFIKGYAAALATGLSSILDAPLRPNNLPGRPPVTPTNQRVTPPNRFATPDDRGDADDATPADQVPLPEPPFNALRAVRRYFLRGGQYAYEGLAGAGAFGSVYRLRKVGGGGGQQGSPEEEGAGRRVAAKLIRRFPDPMYASSPPLEEVEALESFAAAAHAVQMIASQTFGGADMCGLRQWVLLEYLEGGTFRDFEQRVKKRGNALPNRMLWSVFRCLMRIAMAMANSSEMKDGPVRLETAPDDVPHPQTVLYNTDMHTNNLMFGSYDYDENGTEHKLSPILKMIDLGSVERVDTSEDSEWNRISENLRFNGLLESVQSYGTRQPDPGLGYLARICARRAERTFHDRGWSLKDLDERIQRGFEQGPAYYASKMGIDDGSEDDDAVVAVVRELFLDAETSPGTSSGGDTDLDALPDPLPYPNDSDMSL
ncbi:uncharacterized protein PG986_014570 [Apiospora aurea]|uniref:Protein kinase domain-containing protein n=1 Tax=Apiospora aurea TaxID=335848 RepID=A0ABR1PTC7_9PEZI